MTDLNQQSVSIARRRFSKIIVGSVLLLIFAGGMVTSTGSGLAVPDWPLSYGMIFPPMVGGVFYEHGHRMIASVIGLFTLIQAIWIGKTESRPWLRKLGYAALIIVICQGLLGGITVLFFLPKPVSISHAVLAQTFFSITIFIAYAQSIERVKRVESGDSQASPILKSVVLVAATIYVQLILGALMRHMGAGLAIPDFPTVAGQVIPHFNEQSLNYVNAWRFQHGLDAVSRTQMIVHFVHRCGAMMVLLAILNLNLSFRRNITGNAILSRNLNWLNFFVGVQLLLGMTTVWTGKAPVITSLHVVTGAACLGLSVLMLLRVLPLQLNRKNSSKHQEQVGVALGIS